MVKLLFLGRLEDVAGAAELSFPLREPAALADVLLMLPPVLAEALFGPKIKLALNGALIRAEGLTLTDGDELAFLPPVSGG
ncbi:MAG: MoaD/ThiS family protein [Sphingomonadales bacterium]|nr:MoaD/ThiS family protein [Sphingomonadales bacterium]MBU3991794.1 MoaD/ThiS family protein [Alphaproteobacteria bacterium]